jgi:carboxymethylenebutenolidase
MERKKAGDFPPEVLKLFDGYIHGAISRRDFLDSAAKYAVGGFTAAAMLESLAPNYAFAQQVAKDDPRIKTEYLTYPSPQGSGTVRGYLARPANAAGRLPGVVVIHENRGLNPYIEDVARRLAIEGFVAFAPDALSPVGGYPGDDEKAAQLFAKLDPAKRTDDLLTAAAYLKTRPECNGKIGAVGFCFGGTIVNTMAVRIPDLAAAFRSTVRSRPRPKQPGSSRHSSFTTPRSTSASMPAGRLTRPLSRKTAFATRCLCIPARTTASTTTRRRDTTRQRQSWPGRAP